MVSRASISQDYWGNIKEDWGLGDGSALAGSRGGAPVGGLGNEVPQNLKLFCETTHNICIKMNKQQLLLLFTFLGDLDIVSCAHTSRHPERHHF